jgi:hypothetical protein
VSHEDRRSLRITPARMHPDFDGASHVVIDRSPLVSYRAGAGPHDWGVDSGISDSPRPWNPDAQDQTLSRASIGFRAVAHEFDGSGVLRTNGASRELRDESCEAKEGPWQVNT